MINVELESNTKNLYEDFLNNSIKKLKQNKNPLYEVLLEYSPSLVFIKNSSGNVLWANKKALKAINKTLEEIENKTADAYLSTSEASITNNLDAEVLATGKPILDEISVIRYGDKDHLVRRDRVPYRDHDGNIIGIVVFVIDLNENLAAFSSYEDFIEYQRLRDNLNDIIKNIKSEL